MEKRLFTAPERRLITAMMGLHRRLNDAKVFEETTHGRGALEITYALNSRPGTAADSRAIIAAVKRIERERKNERRELMRAVDAQIESCLKRAESIATENFRARNWLLKKVTELADDARESLVAVQSARANGELLKRGRKRKIVTDLAAERRSLMKTLSVRIEKIITDL